MINCKQDYKQYLLCDRNALGITRSFPIPFIDDIWIFERCLRKTEYYNNCRKDILGKFRYILLRIRLYRLSVKMGFSIPLNVFKEGLSIAHRGTIIVNGNASIGKNCRIQDGVTIGATNGSILAPKIGDNVFIGSGAKIIGDIEIADDVAIGAQSLVVKSVLENGITIGGIPAKKISSNNSHSNLLVKL